MSKRPFMMSLSVGGLILICFQSASAQNLVVNGSFEIPDIPTGTFILVLDTNGTPIPGWNATGGNNIIEIQDHIAGDSAPGAGDQFVELDSDISSGIQQRIPTQPNCLYDVSFLFSPRPETPEADNILKVTWNGTAFPLISAAGGSQTDWKRHTFPNNVPSTLGNTTLAFEDLGTSNAMGTFVDLVTVEEFCPAGTQPSNWVPNVGELDADSGEQPLGDMWTFNCPIGSTLTFRVDTKDDLDTGESCIDPVLVIVDPAGNVVATGDDELPCKYPPTCGFGCPEVIIDCPVNLFPFPRGPHSLIVRDFGVATSTDIQCNKGGGYELRVHMDALFGPPRPERIRLGGGPRRSVPEWAVLDGKAPVGPALDDENVPYFDEFPPK